MHDPAEPESFKALSDLQLQLVQLRAEARAARLEALAARLERLLRCQSSEAQGRRSVDPRSRGDVTELLGLGASPRVQAEQAARTASRGGVEASDAPEPLDVLTPWPESWEVFLGADAGCREGSSSLESPSKTDRWIPAPSIPQDADTKVRLSQSVDALGSAEFLRWDSSGSAVPAVPAVPAAAFRIDASSEAGAESLDREISKDGDRLKMKGFRRFSGRFATPGPVQTLPEVSGKFELTATSPIDDARGALALKRRRPTALGVSLVLHAVALLVFAGISITSQLPKDAIVLSAIRAEESFEIQVAEFETAESPEDTTVASQVDSSMSDTPVDVLVQATAAVLPLSSVPTTLPAPVPGSSSMVGVSGLADSLPQDVSTQFFGVNGGGNSFVYLVDSSRSMDDVSRDGFEVARNELLRAIDQLTERQKFCVIFFGEETWTMPFGEQAGGMQRLVSATSENKESLRRWALSLQMQPGAWPREALQVAFKLRPDCIFLLTDGAMSENVIPLIKRENIVDTLFDGPKPRSIIHTIGFHNSEGEARLREIATLSGGAYRFVPPTGTVRR